MIFAPNENKKKKSFLFIFNKKNKIHGSENLWQSKKKNVNKH